VHRIVLFGHHTWHYFIGVSLGVAVVVVGVVVVVVVGVVVVLCPYFFNSVHRPTTIVSHGEILLTSWSIVKYKRILEQLFYLCKPLIRLIILFYTVTLRLINLLLCNYRHALLTQR